MAGATYIALLAADESGSATHLGKLLKIDRSNAYRRLAVLERLGLVKRVLADLKPGAKTKYWTLTTAGKHELKVLRRVFGNRNIDELLRTEIKIRFRPHAAILKFSIVEVPEDLVKRLVDVGGMATARGFMDGYQIHHDGNKIFFNKSSMLIYPKEVYAGSVYEAAEQLLELGFQISKKMERRFPGLLLEGSFDLCRHHIAMLGGITRWVPSGFHYGTNRLVIDFSTGVAEVETIDKQYAVEDMHRIAKFLDLVGRGAIDPEELRETLFKLTQAVANVQKRSEVQEDFLKRFGGMQP
ncbi:helix-turn-helix transcriptional regulator [Candidatus Micrarchaeota archaeon]|nr:helix-turn-helix transcriptional regulator [Candidatus Micrarchaeota archaeon]